MEDYWADSPEGAVGKRETTESKINCPGVRILTETEKVCWYSDKRLSRAGP